MRKGLLVVVALVLSGCGSGGGVGHDPKPNRCDQVKKALDHMEDELNGTAASIKVIDSNWSKSNAFAYSDDLTVQGLQVQYRAKIQQAAYLVVGDPRCFEPGDVAASKTVLANMSK